MTKFLSYAALSCLLLASSQLKGETASPPQIDFDEGRELIIHNRILARVNDRTISVLDVAKKMDVFLTQHYPQFARSKLARFEFYMNNWRHILNQLIDQELMIADAEGKDLKISDGDIRETLQTRFGPNVMATLDQLNLTYEEAREMIHSEMVVQRMTWFKIHSKAMLRVVPQDIKNAYKTHCEQNGSNDEWHYRVLTIRNPNGSIGSEIASKAHEMLTMGKTGLEAVAHTLAAAYNHQQESGISLSQKYCVSDRDMASTHKDVLLTLQPGSFSIPVPQQSRIDGTTVYRIFHLEEHLLKPLPSFRKVSNQIKDELLDAASNEESVDYLRKLRERFGFDERYMRDMIPDHFQPFSLR